jgi:hypothetical protein
MLCTMQSIDAVLSPALGVRDPVFDMGKDLTGWTRFLNDCNPHAADITSDRRRRVVYLIAVPIRDHFLRGLLPRTEQYAALLNRTAAGVRLVFGIPFVVRARRGYRILTPCRTPGDLGQALCMRGVPRDMCAGARLRSLQLARPSSKHVCLLGFSRPSAEAIELAGGLCRLLWEKRPTGYCNATLDGVVQPQSAKPADAR